MDKKITYIKICLTAFVLLVTSNVFAQEEELVIPLSNPDRIGELKMYLINGSITVVGHTGKDVIINTTLGSSSYKRKSKSKNKYGLKRVEASSNGFTVEEVDNKVRIKSGHGNKHINFEIKVPLKFNLNLRTVNNSNIYVENVSGQHEVSNTNGKIDMKNVSGSVIADALNRNITISFKNVKNNAPMAFTSLNGNLDITFPANVEADIKAKTDNGEVYTDFDMKLDKKPISKTSKKSGVYRVKVEKWTYGKINGGGAEMTFKTLNGDIIIRKG